MGDVKYRHYTPGLELRRTRLEIPGWAGQREPRKDGSHEHPWHCLPFTESARYGIELVYPYETELHVHMRDGELVFEGDFGPAPEPGLQWPPFRPFGKLFYTYQVSLDLKVEPGLAFRTEPHPRFFTDPTETTPIAVPALIRRWWPMMFFMVFKSPADGRTHVFRPREPFAQIIVIPEQADFDLVPMAEDEAAERELQSRRIHESRSTLGADTQWVSDTNTVFDGTYRHILGAAAERARKDRP